MENTMNGYGSSASLSAVDRKVANALFSFNSLIQKHFHDTVEVQTVMFFLTIASKEAPEDMTAIGKALNLSKAAISRNYYKLSKGHRDNVGLGLIQAIYDPMDIRRKLLTLTPSGIEVARYLAESILDSVKQINEQA